MAALSLLVTGSVAWSQEGAPATPVQPAFEPGSDLKNDEDKKSKIVPGVIERGGGPSGEKMGASVSDVKANGYLIESARPQRVPVFPDDPDSAWWEINPRYAFQRAQREQKPLLLLFTGDWNTKAMKLSEEVFSTKSFNEYSKKNLVLCYLNYPKNITDAPDSLREMKTRFKIKGYPNVLIFNPNGEVDTHISGYRSGRPVDYFNKLTGNLWTVLEQIKYHKKDLGKYGYRDWVGGEKDTTIFAKFVRRDPDLVTLQGANGVQWTVAIKTLAPEDRAFAESFPTVDQIANVPK